MDVSAQDVSWSSAGVSGAQRYGCVSGFFGTAFWWVGGKPGVSGRLGGVLVGRQMRTCSTIQRDWLWPEGLDTRLVAGVSLPNFDLAQKFRIA